MQLFDVHLGGEGVVEWLYTASKKCSTALLVVQLGTNSLYIYVCVCVRKREIFLCLFYWARTETRDNISFFCF